MRLSLWKTISAALLAAASSVTLGSAQKLRVEVEKRTSAIPKVCESIAPVSIEGDIDMAGLVKEAICKGAGDMMTEYTYIDRNQAFIPNYGERYRNGERISTGFVESAVNQVVSKRMAKKQQMQWSRRGAHLLLQVRTRVLNGEWEETFRAWYPGFRQQAQSAAA